MRKDKRGLSIVFYATQAGWLEKLASGRGCKNVSEYMRAYGIQAIAAHEGVEAPAIPSELVGAGKPSFDMRELARVLAPLVVAELDRVTTPANEHASVARPRSDVAPRHAIPPPANGNARTK